MAIASVYSSGPWRPADAHWDAYLCRALLTLVLVSSWHSLCRVCKWFISGLTHNVFGEARVESWKRHLTHIILSSRSKCCLLGHMLVILSNEYKRMQKLLLYNSVQCIKGSRTVSCIMVTEN